MARSPIRRLTAALFLLAAFLPAAAYAGGAASGALVKHGLSGQTYVWQAGSC